MLGHGGVHETEGESTSVFMGIDEGAYVSIDTQPLVRFATAYDLDRKKLGYLRLEDPNWRARHDADCTCKFCWPAKYLYHDCWPADSDIYFMDERVLHAKVISNELKSGAGTKIFLHLCAHSPRCVHAKSIIWVDAKVAQQLNLYLRLRKTERSDRCRQCRNDLIGLHIFKRAFPLVDVASNTLRKMLVI